MDKKNIPTLPDLPGVYLFKNKENTILYIGKALSLKKRVAHYFQKQSSDWKIDALLAQAETVDYVQTNTEVEALLLEAQLVQEYKPKFNVLLKSGQPFVYLHISNDPLPQLELTRNEKKSGTYFGPFIHKQDARKTVAFLTETFSLLCCNKKIDNGCLDYHLGRCAGTCMQNFDREGYLTRLALAQTVLKKDRSAFLHTIDQHIKAYITLLEFEKARTLQSYKENVEVIFHTLATKYSTEKYAPHVAASTIEKETITFVDYQQTAVALRDLLHLEITPITIDCFDISHFQGHAITGSCIRFNKGLPEKNKFRRFKIKTLTTQNDYAALQEIVARRYKNDDYPDLIMIDGGKGQLNAIVPIIPTVACISLAKREETVFAPHLPDGIVLDQASQEGKLLMALRDYTHHFAITYHRLLRRKQQ